MAHTFEDLVNLEQAAEAERAKLTGLADDEYDAQWRAWRAAAEAFQAAVAAHEEDGKTRYEVEQAVKKAVRHPEG